MAQAETARIEHISLIAPDDEIVRLIQNSSQFRCDLLELNTRGKKKLRFLISAVMGSVGKPEYADELAASVLELAFNALKANYAHAIVLDFMKPLFDDRSEKFMDQNAFFSDRVLQRTYMGLVNSKNVIDKVREVLRLEKKVFDIHEKAGKQGREITEAEKEAIEGHLLAFAGIIKVKVRSTLRFVKVPSKVVIDVINDAPISETGMERIRQKRLNFRKYYDENRVEDFYTENLDESESAGFGSAMIDSRLLQWGYKPEQHFKVLSLNNKTCASLTLTF
ncbi:MAG: hypothetical protein J0L75_13895 [Spirochaetes bacterium]|nr:hypothetical protein [Spirochaetota bacterium]